MTALVSGVYGYADYENMLPLLAELCGVEDTGRETLIPALIGWLYETEDVALPSRQVTPKSKRALARKRQSFGERLDRAMTLLGLSNNRLSALLNIDVSMVSRYRAGLYSPHKDQRRAQRLAAVLLDWAEGKGLQQELETLCGIPAGTLDGAAVSQWLYETAEDADTELAQRLLRSLDTFTPGQGLPAEPPALPPIEATPCYWGTEGLRRAVVRFLSDASEQGGELLLYSDEPMDWMAGDRDYFALWASLMVACVKNGVRIKIIHNVDRAGPEIIDAIQGWFPLYISGTIEPYVFTRPRNARFCHTVFLHRGRACIHAFSPTGAADRWYDYLTEKPKLDALEREYETMLSAASPFLKTYPAAMGGDFLRFRMDRKGDQTYLLSGPPVATMPEGLLERMLSRAEISPETRRDVLGIYRDIRKRFAARLEQSSVNMILCPASGRSRQVNFSLDLVDLSLDYTPEEYGEHLAAVAALVEGERNFHLTLLPETPFRDIQIVTLEDAVAVLRCWEPYGAFVFLNPTLKQSVSDYLGVLMEQYAEDRRTMIEALRELGTE